MKNNMMMTIVVAVIAAVVGGGIGFYVSKMPQFNSPTADTASGGGGRQRGQGGQGFMNRGAMGQITSMDDKSFTVKMLDGTSKIVLFSDSTTFENTAKAQKSDVKTGINVRVIGNPNSDGSITATDVMLNPVMFMGRGQGGNGASGSGQQQGQ